MAGGWCEAPDVKRIADELIAKHHAHLAPWADEIRVRNCVNPAHLEAHAYVEAACKSRPERFDEADFDIEDWEVN